jgi:hypothetical protein
MAGLDPAIPLSKARSCHIVGIAGSSPAMTVWERRRPTSPARRDDRVDLDHTAGARALDTGADHREVA